MDLKRLQQMAGIATSEETSSLQEAASWETGGRDHAQRLKNALDAASVKKDTRRDRVPGLGYQKGFKGEHVPPNVHKAMKMATAHGFKVHGRHAKRPQSFYAQAPDGTHHHFFHYATGVGDAWGSERVHPHEMSLSKKQKKESVETSPASPMELMADYEKVLEAAQKDREEKEANLEYILTLSGIGDFSNVEEAKYSFHRKHGQDAAARAFHVSAWADHEEAKGRSHGGQELMDVAPKTSRHAHRHAKKFIDALEKTNGKKFHELVHAAAHADGHPEHANDEHYVRNFGHHLAMQSMGHGVSWFDDHKKFNIKIPHSEYHHHPKWSEIGHTHSEYHAESVEKALGAAKPLVKTHAKKHEGVNPSEEQLRNQLSEDVSEIEDVERFRRIAGLTEAEVHYGPGWSSTGAPVGTVHHWEIGDVKKTPEGWKKIVGKKVPVPGKGSGHRFDATAGGGTEDESFKALSQALTTHNLPTSKGERRAYPEEFMLMGRHVSPEGKTSWAHFKHRDTRNYLHLDIDKQQLHIPKTGEPFNRGEFDKFEHREVFDTMRKLSGVE